MPKAIVIPLGKTDTTYFVKCPGCGEFKDSPDGSAQWTPREITQHPQQKCGECLTPFEIVS